MKCLDIKPLIHLYVDDRLDTETKKQVDEHLFTCSECNKDFNLLKKTVGVVRSLEGLKTSDDFIERLNEKIDNQWSFKKMMSSFYNRFPLKVTGVTVLLLLSLFILKKSNSNRPILKGSDNSIKITTKINKIKLSNLNIEPELKKLLIKYKVTVTSFENNIITLNVALSKFSEFSKNLNKYSIKVLSKNKKEVFMRIELTQNMSS